MKSFKRIAYIVLLAIVVILGFTIYSNAVKNNKGDDSSKSLAEIKFLESKFVNLFNKMNNIQTRNYQISYGEISKETNTGKSSSDSTSSKSGQGGGQASEESEGTEESEEGQSGEGSSSSSSVQKSNSSNSTSGDTQQNNTKYELNMSGILNQSNEINWDEVKNEVENLYASIPTITMDLYKINLNQDDILAFNKEFDNLVLSIKDENKEETLKQLSKLYEYIPKFVSNVVNEELYKRILETKSNIFKAYSKLESENWSEMSNDIANGINVYSQLLTSTNIDSSKQYNINRMYIMLNELKNSVSLKDKSIFLIKYKNVIEEIENIDKSRKSET